jgi:hypothetical protein
LEFIYEIIQNGDLSFWRFIPISRLIEDLN